MKISKLREVLDKIEAKFGDIAVTGGSMMDDRPLRDICVTDAEGREIWPSNYTKSEGPHKIDGIFFQS